MSTLQEIKGITCFAPPLSPGKIGAYRALAEGCGNRRCKQEMLALIKMVEVSRETPESSIPAINHPIGVLPSTGRVPQVIPLEQQEIDRIQDLVPTGDDCDLISSVFKQLEDTETKNAAYHLLWFARELSQNREPITQDKL